nr:hypothetical protein [Tanacetum cinerariifolium]
MASITQKPLVIIITLISLNLIITTTTFAKTNDIHDILPEYGLPVGVLPDAVQSYTLSPTYGSFTVILTNPCYVKFDDQTVYYDKTNKGKLTYGSSSNVSGIQAKELFVWLSVTGMDLDVGGDMVEFRVGVLSKKLPVDMFRDVPESTSPLISKTPQSFNRNLIRAYRFVSPHLLESNMKAWYENTSTRLKLRVKLTISGSGTERGGFGNPQWKTLFPNLGPRTLFKSYTKYLNELLNSQP